MLLMIKGKKKIETVETLIDLMHNKSRNVNAALVDTCFNK